jgi:tetratricopeptide (TPR) repeat protein
VRARDARRAPVERRASALVERWAWSLVLCGLLAACGGKPVTAPPPNVAPKFAEFVFPAAPANLGPKDLLDAHTRAWQFLQAGDTKAADRDFTAILKIAPAFYPAEAGLGYSAFARKDSQAAVTHFDKALAANTTYAPALAGKGDALLALGKTDAALDAFQGALAADPSLTALRERVGVLTFRRQQDNIASARKAAEAGHLDDARRGYLAAIAASPDSAFLYRELATVEHKAGEDTSALGHAEQAVKLDAADARALTLVAEIYEAQKAWAQAADAYTAVNALDPSDATAAKIDTMRENAAFDAMPEEYRHIDQSPSITRAQLAALLAVHLKGYLRPARASQGLVILDTRGNWAAQWILEVVRAGVIDIFPNHTFQPSAAVHRSDLAQAVARVLAGIGQQKPKVIAPLKDAHPSFPDVAPTNLSYQAAAWAVASGVMTTLNNGTFQPTRPVSGSEALDTVTKLEALAKKK